MKKDEPKIDLELDNKFNGILIITCPRCRKKMKEKFQNLRSKKNIECSCGFTVSFAGGDLRDVQRSLNSLKRTFDKLGK